jgi:polyphosphate kinase 2
MGHKHDKHAKKHAGETNGADLATELSPDELVAVAGDDRDVGDGDPSDADVAAHPSLVDLGDHEPEHEHHDKLHLKQYEKELAKLQVELVKLEEWIRHAGLKVVVLFEGRDAAGKGGAIKTITYSLNPRVARVVALGVPSDREKSQWYFQRYVPHLPAAGEIVFFDRSWYNRGGVERVMGYCTEDEYQEFLRSCPEFERMLVRSGILVIKYWFSVSPDEQERRFQARAADPTKRWKLSPVDLASRAKWDEYSRAKDTLFAYTDIKQAPWYVVDADDKRRARLNVIRHLLGLIPYDEIPAEPVVLPDRPRPRRGYMRPPKSDQTYVPSVY